MVTTEQKQPAQPGREHELLSRFAGTWRAEVKIWMQPGGEPMTSTGKMTNTMVIGGRFLEQDYKDDSGMFEGKGFWGYNADEGKYEGLWIDSMATFFQLDDQGSHDPATDTYTMSGTLPSPTGGTPTRRTSLIRYLGADKHSIEMFLEPPDGERFKTMEIQYTRT